MSSPLPNTPNLLRNSGGIQNENTSPEPRRKTSLSIHKCTNENSSREGTPRLRVDERLSRQVEELTIRCRHLAWEHDNLSDSNSGLFYENRRLKNQIIELNTKMDGLIAEMNKLSAEVNKLSKENSNQDPSERPIPEGMYL